MSPGKVVGVLAVMDAMALRCALERDQHDTNNDKPTADSWERKRLQMHKARAKVLALITAMADIGEHARPDNWDDESDPDQRRAWLDFDAALAGVRK